MAAKIFLTFTRGQKMPALGIGTWETKEEHDIETSINSALELGYRHIDTASAYGNEKVIGRVLKEWISSGKIKREDLFITTKLPPLGNHPDKVESFLKTSLENLQLDYVDLYLIHIPVGMQYDQDENAPVDHSKLKLEGPTDHAGIWQKMEEQVREGRAKNIGLSNYNISQITTVLKSAKIKPANLQIELHVYLQQKELVKFCKSKGITIVAYCPLGNPNMQNYLESVGQKCQLPNLLGDPTVAKLAEKYSKTPAQIVLRFLLQLGVAAIPKSVKPSRIAENIDVFDFEIDQEDMETLYGLDMGEAGRLVNMSVIPGFKDHPDYPFK